VGSDWHLLEAFEHVIRRLLGERRVDYRTLSEVEAMRDELERELLARPVEAPPERDEAVTRPIPPPAPPPRPQRPRRGRT